MKLLKTILPLVALLLSVFTFKSAAAATKLPTITVSDKEFYVYEIEKGDTFYGISKKFGWSYEILNRTNKVNNSKIKDGQFVFYPIADNGESPNTHIVQKGETIYSIAKKYDISTDDLYALNPNAKFGIKAGETLVLHKDNIYNKPKETIIYNVKFGDTLSSISEQFNTSVKRLFELNPTLTASNLNDQSELKIEQNSNFDNTTIETYETKEVFAFKPYKVEKNDTWTGISNANTISIEELQSANPSVKTLKKGKFIYIPLYETVTKELSVYQQDARELSDQGCEEIYNEVHNTFSSDIPGSQAAVSAAIIVDIKNNKTRDAEFLKGFLMGIDRLKNRGYNINLKVYDISDTPTSSLIDSGELNKYNFIIATYDENFPTELAEFGKSNDIEIVNLFDIKDEQYLTNHSMIQGLPPTNCFNKITSDFLASNFADKTFVFIGETDADDSDAVDKSIKTYLDEQGTKYIEIASLEHFAEIQFEENGNYILYPQITKKDDIDKFINTTIKLMNENPSVQLCVIGRPNWITLVKSMQEYFCQINTYIPSRFYFDKEADEAKKFEVDFSENFGYAPVQTNPIFAVVGYDTARFLIESYAENGGDLNMGMADYNALQTDFNLQRVDSWSGMFNNRAYMIHFTPFNTIEKIKL